MDQNNDLIFYISIGVIVAFFIFVALAINHPEWFYKDENKPSKKKKRKMFKTKVLLSDLLFAVEKIARENGETYFSASASMNPLYEIEMKAYISGFDLVNGSTIKEVCDNLLASKHFYKKEEDGKTVQLLEAPKVPSPETEKKVKPLVYEEIVLQ